MDELKMQNYKTTKIEVLERQPSDMGSFIPVIERTEWTPGGGDTPIRSTWKTETGKRLTNKRIAQYEREGWYGKARQEKALKVSRTIRAHAVFRCKCGVNEEVRFLTYSYLPQSGYYCPRCLAQYRRQRDLEHELKVRVRTAMVEEYQ